MNGKLDPARADRAVTRSATSGFQKPTTPYERWLLDLEELQAFVKTQSCRELFDREHDRKDLACSVCLSSRYYLPGAQTAGRFTKEELEGLLVGFNACRGYSSEKVLPFMVDKAGTRNSSCHRLIRSAEQFCILEFLRQRIERVEWAKIQRGEGN